MSDYVTLLFGVWAIGMTILYYRENQYRRDVLTDLVQLVHDCDLSGEDLRRSRGVRFGR